MPPERTAHVYEPAPVEIPVAVVMLLTETGVELSLVDPYPSMEPAPQHLTVPLPSNAHDQPPLTVTDVALSMLLTATGVLLWLVEPFPN